MYSSINKILLRKNYDFDGQTGKGKRKDSIFDNLEFDWLNEYQVDSFAVNIVHEQSVP